MCGYIFFGAVFDFFCAGFPWEYTFLPHQFAHKNKPLTKKDKYSYLARLQK
jgi:hypothetical protein